MLEALKEFGVTFLNLCLQYLLPPLLAMIAGYVIAWLRKKIQAATDQMDDQTTWAIKEAVRAAVLAAEQVHLKDVAIDKKNYAIDKATQWLSAKGIPVDLTTLDTMVEAAVMQEFNKSKVAGANPVI